MNTSHTHAPHLDSIPVPVAIRIDSTPDQIANQLELMAEYMYLTNAPGYYHINDTFFIELLFTDSTFCMSDYKDGEYVSTASWEEQIMFILMVAQFLRTDGFEKYRG